MIKKTKCCSRMVKTWWRIQQLVPLQRKLVKWTEGKIKKTWLPGDFQPRPRWYRAKEIRWLPLALLNIYPPTCSKGVTPFVPPMVSSLFYYFIIIELLRITGFPAKQTWKLSSIYPLYQYKSYPIITFILFQTTTYAEEGPWLWRSGPDWSPTKAHQPRRAPPTASGRPTGEFLNLNKLKHLPVFF